MIKINSRTKRSFLFPAEPTQTFQYYSDFACIFGYLPHIHLLQSSPNGQYHLRYQATELGIYRITIHCHVQTHLDQAARVIRISPVNGAKDVKTRTGLQSLVASGSYTSESRFSGENGKTLIEYSLEISAEVPKPLGMRFVPVSFVNRIANNIAHARMDEIIESFIERSIAKHGFADESYSD